MVSENGRVSGGPSPDPHQASLQPAHSSPPEDHSRTLRPTEFSKNCTKTESGVKKKKKNRKAEADVSCLSVCVHIHAVEQQREADLFKFCDYL